jgi:hypothetical protein
VKALALAGCALLGAAIMACGGDVNRDEYITKNDALLDTLPLYPGAELFRRQDLPYSDSEMGPITGYGTSVQYSVAADVNDEDVVQFYETHLSEGWTSCEYEIHYGAAENPGPTPSSAGSVTAAVFYRADGASVGVLTDGLAPVTDSDSYELDIDHHYSGRTAC